MKGWLGRAAAGTAARGEQGSRVVRWTRWYGRRGAVPDDRFQGPEDPYPGHWRELPRPWPDDVGTDPRVPELLRRGLDDLPEPWRAVLRRRDLGHPEASTATEPGLDPATERNVLNQARAAVRRRLAEFLGRGVPW